MENFETYRLDQTGQQTQAILDQVSTNTADIAQLYALYEALTQNEPVIIQPSDTWPVADPQENVIYRVIDRVNTPPQSYSDYMWNGTTMVLMATYNNSIDNEPTPGSNNLVKSGGVAASIVFDISAYHATGSTLATYANLAAALGTDGENVPASVRKGGMSVKFVQSSDNKYVQYRYMGTDVTTAATFTNTANWQGVDDEPTSGSENLVKSGGVYNSSYRFNIFNKKEFLDCVKEFYVADSTIDLSAIVCGRLHYGSTHTYAIEFCSSNDFTQVVLELRGNLTSSVIKSSNNNAYAIVAWNKVAYYCNGADVKPVYDLTVDNVKPKIEGFWPALKAYLMENGSISVLQNKVSTIENTAIPAIKKSKGFITSNDALNELLGELYISNQSIDYSNVGYIRLYFGYSNRWGVDLFTSSYGAIASMYITSTTKPSSLIIGNNGGAVIDWDTLLATQPGRNYVDVQVNSVEPVLIKDINFSPTIKSYYEDEKIKKELATWNMNISNLDTINECVKELYYDDKEVDLSQYTIFRFYYGSSNAYGIQIYKQGYADGIEMWKKIPDVDLNSSFLQGTMTNGHHWYIVLNWSKIQEVCGSALYRDITGVLLNPYINQSPCYWPAIYSEIVGNKDAYYQHIVNVYPNQETPCQIANLIRSITDASADNRYKILVHDGEYAETDIVTKDYIDIVGETYQGAVLIHDGDATYDSPDDYSMGNQYSNIPVNTIPWQYKHLIYHMSNSSVKNITLKTVGGQCKYICHQDGGSNKFTAIFDHCNFVNGSGTNILGVGAKGGQYMKYIDCQFIENNRNRLVDREHSFNLHNTNNQTESCGLRFENCNFTHTGWIHVLELGSGHTDYFEFIDCVCNNERTFIRFTATSEETSYGIILRVIGGNMGGIAPDGERPNTKLSIQSRFIDLIYNPATIPFGTPLYNNAPAANANNGYVFKLSDVDDVYNMKTISTYDVGFGLAEAGNYAYGDNLYINNGKFTKTVNGNVAGTVKQAIELSEEGYVMIQKTH